MMRELRKPTQMLRSWYTVFFQLPCLPEMGLRARNYDVIRTVLRRDPIRRRTFTKLDINRYVQAMSQPGAATATINYYRAAFRIGPRRVLQRIRRIKAPTLLIWGDQDRYLETGMTQGLEEWVPNLRVARLPNVSHWVQNEAPEQVNELMIQFLKESKSS